MLRKETFWLYFRSRKHPEKYFICQIGEKIRVEMQSRNYLKLILIKNSQEVLRN